MATKIEFLNQHGTYFIPVFVYGSLKKGFGNHDLLANAFVGGKVVTSDAIFGMASYEAYPACYIPKDDEATNKIHGELYGVNKELLRVLDRLESNGSFYNRVLVPVECPKTGQVINAWIYLLYGYSPPKSKNRVKFDEKLGALTWTKIP